MTQRPVIKQLSFNVYEQLDDTKASPSPNNDPDYDSPGPNYSPTYFTKSEPETSPAEPTSAKKKPITRRFFRAGGRSATFHHYDVQEENSSKTKFSRSVPVSKQSSLPVGENGDGSCDERTITDSTSASQLENGSSTPTRGCAGKERAPSAWSRLFNLPLQRSKSAGGGPDSPNPGTPPPHALFLSQKSSIMKSGRKTLISQDSQNEGVYEGGDGGSSSAVTTKLDRKKKRSINVTQAQPTTPTRLQFRRGLDVREKFAFFRRQTTDSLLATKAQQLKDGDKSVKAGRPSVDRVRSWGHSFDALLTDSYGLGLFREFLRTEFSDENIEFWIACEEYKTLTGSRKMHSKALKIFNDYVAVQAKREVNLDSTTRVQTQQEVASPTRHTFDLSQKRIQALMEKDSYQRFLRSEVYNNVLRECLDHPTTSNSFDTSHGSNTTTATRPYSGSQSANTSAARPASVSGSLDSTSARPVSGSNTSSDSTPARPASVSDAPDSTSARPASVSDAPDSTSARPVSVSDSTPACKTSGSSYASPESGTTTSDSTGILPSKASDTTDTPSIDLQVLDQNNTACLSGSQTTDSSLIECPQSKFQTTDNSTSKSSSNAQNSDHIADPQSSCTSVEVTDNIRSNASSDCLIISSTQTPNIILYEPCIGPAVESSQMEKISITQPEEVSSTACLESLPTCSISQDDSTVSQA